MGLSCAFKWLGISRLAETYRRLLGFFMLKMMDVWIVSEKIINLSFRLINHIYHEVNNYEI